MQWRSRMSNAALIQQVKQDSIRSRRRYRRLPMAAWDPSQVATQNINGKAAAMRLRLSRNASHDAYAASTALDRVRQCCCYFLLGCAYFQSLFLQIG